MEISVEIVVGLVTLGAVAIGAGFLWSRLRGGRSASGSGRTRSTTLVPDKKIPMKLTKRLVSTSSVCVYNGSRREVQLYMHYYSAVVKRLSLLQCCNKETVLVLTVVLKRLSLYRVLL